MKTGTYKISFNVDLNECENEEEAKMALFHMFQNMMDEGDFPEVEFDLLEEFDLEYMVEENELKELEF